MKIEVRGAREHNLKDVDVTFHGALTVVTGISGSGKSSLAFDTVYHEARRRFLDIYGLGSITDRLAPAKVRDITGLRPAVAVGQDLLNRNPNSTVATASGLRPLFRVLFARFGRRSCHACGNQLELLDHDAAGARLTALSALGSVTVKAPLIHAVSGSHRTLLGFLLETYGSEAVMVDERPLPAVEGEPSADGLPEPDVAHSIDLKMGRFDGEITAAQARQLIDDALALGAWALKVNRGQSSELLGLTSSCAFCGTPFNELEPVDFGRSCPHCQGTGCPECFESGLDPEAATVRWANLSLMALSALSVDQARQLFAAEAPTSPAGALLLEIDRRLAALQDLGLGYLGLDRPAPTLSRGEAQRLRLATALVSQLEEMLYVLDEPTIGQHPADVSRLLPTLRQLKGQVLFVEHDRQAAALADQVIDLGPGAGREGGQVTFTGTPAELWRSATDTGRHFSHRQRVWRPADRPQSEQFLTLRGVHLRNLDDIDVPIPLGRMTVICGVSGSGKSTLVDDVLVASLESGEPTGCRSVTGPVLKPLIVDQKPIGKNPRSNPATYTKLSDIIREQFTAASSLPASYFSFNRKEGACPDCGGMGAIEVKMRYLPPTWVICAGCEGSRFSDEVLAVSAPIGQNTYSIADFYRLTAAEALLVVEQSDDLPPPRKERALRIVKALIDVGLGYLTLGQPSPTLSGGEAQRLKLARVLGGRKLSSRLLVLDEPTTGLHPHDTVKLLDITERLVSAGATVVVVEHNLDVITAADWIVDLGPGAGPLGGQLLYAGPLSGLEKRQDSPTAQALASRGAIKPREGASKPPAAASRQVRIRNARAHNLKGIDVDIPKDALTIFTGLSGSGKSTLLHNVLEHEARRRFLESLSMYERQAGRPGPEVHADEVSGLGVVVSIVPERQLFDRRATVGTATEISHHLAILLAWSGGRTCLACGRPMRPIRPTASGLLWECGECGAREAVDARHFSPWHYAAACQTCNGVGTLQIPNPEKLIVAPERPLCAGAMYSPGFFPKGYLCKPLNGGYDMVQALAARHGFDPFETPWQDMDQSAREAFLFGDPEPMDVHFRSRNQSYVRRQAFPGFYGFIRDWDVGGTYTDTAPCPACDGARLRPEYLATNLAGHHYHALGEMDLRSLLDVIQAIGRNQRDWPLARPSELIEASRRVVDRRLHFLARVGVAYLNLNRITATLSAGEAQRIRLAGLLGGELSGLTILLDEPTRGLHPGEVQALLDALHELRDQGNCVIVIEHDLAVIRAADHVIDIGPGAGVHGGTVVAQGKPTTIAASQSPTGRWLRQEQPLISSRKARRPAGWLTINGAEAHNLRGQSISFPRRMLVGVCGVSGSGKSTLVVDTLGRALAPRKHTTSVASEPLEPGSYDSIEGAPARTLFVDQVRRGVSSPASFLNLERPLRELYGGCEQAVEMGLTAANFIRNCASCKGRGETKIDLGILPSLRAPCEVCYGTGYAAQAHQLRLAGQTLPELTQLTIGQLLDLMDEDEIFELPAIRRPLEAARDVGLDYLVLRQPGHALSGGEAQRLKIARELCRRSQGETLYILDEPSLGQHMEDLRRLSAILRRLVDDGNSVIVVEHEVHILAACDWLVELGPGGGPQGGKVVFAGEPARLAAGNTPMAPYLRPVRSNASIK